MPGLARGAGAYRGGFNEPAGEIGGRIMLLDTSGPLMGESPTGWYEITFCEPIFGLGPHGTVVLWSQSATPPAGYGTSVPTGSATGSIAAGSTTTSSPNVFQMGRHQLLQFRWIPRFVGTLASFVFQDVDITVALPAATPRNMTMNQQSRWNSRFQPLLASDTAVAPAQGANQANPANPVSLSPFDWMQATELFVYEQTYLPTWTIINNSSVAMNSSANAIVLDIMGFRLDLQPIMSPDPDWVPKTLFGKRGSHPRDNYTILPITGRGVSAISQG